MTDRTRPVAAPYEIHPLTPERWDDFERLFGPQGAYSGCWCMYWRVARSRFTAQAGEGNRRAMAQIVAAGEVPGILAYHAGEPVAWCSVAPRESFASLERSRVLKRLDDAPVWSIVCFFLGKEQRRRDRVVDLIRGAVEYARSRGARIVEAYPTAPRGRRLAAVSSYQGVPSAFARAGFVECARPSEAKVIMRRYLD
jgi:hypothetical protein